MIKTGFKQKESIKEFVEYWKDRGYEKGESQPFWISLLKDVFDVDHPEKYISFEDKVFLDNTSFIDGYIEKTKVLIEQKSLGKDLNKPIKQSDGTLRACRNYRSARFRRREKLSRTLCKQSD